MRITSTWSFNEALGLVGSTIATCSISSPPPQQRPLYSPIWSYTFPIIPSKSPAVIITRAKNRRNNSHTTKPVVVLKPNIVDDVSIDEEEDLIFDEIEDDDDDEFLDEDGDFEDDYLEEKYVEPFAGDGEGGGGISLAGTTWDKEALAIAEEVTLSFGGDLGIYAFKTLLNSTIRVRVEKLSNKSGSPAMSDIDAFTLAYRERLNEAELAGSIPDVSLEVSSPGVERVVRIPQDLDRFKERAMYVKYLSEEPDTDVRVNREKAGKGRPLHKKQREWRLETHFDSLRLVRIYSDY